MNKTQVIQYRAKKRNIEMKKEEEFKKKLKIREDKNNDTTIRVDIHAVITKGIKEGKNKKEIIESLSEERFKKYKEFFEIWIDDQIRKQLSKEER